MQETVRSPHRGRLIAGLVFSAAGLSVLLVGVAQRTSAVGLIAAGALGILIGLVLVVRRPADTAPASRMTVDGLSPDFTVALRGYDCRQVNDLVRRGGEALRSSDTQQRLAVRAEIESASLQVAVRGYVRDQVDAYVKALAVALAAPSETPK